MILADSPSTSCKKLSGGFTYFIVDTFNFQLCLVHLTVLLNQSSPSVPKGSFNTSHFTLRDNSAKLLSHATQVFDVFDEQPSLVFALVLARSEAIVALEYDVTFTVLWVFLEVDSFFE